MKAAPPARKVEGQQGLAQKRELREWKLRELAPVEPQKRYPRRVSLQSQEG